MTRFDTLSVPGPLLDELTKHGYADATPVAA